MENDVNNINVRIDNIEKQLEFLVAEAKVARRNRRIVMVLTLLFVVLPIVIFLIALPSVISQMTSMYQI